MMPALLIIVLMPLISFAMFKFLFIPMIKAEIPEQAGAEEKIDHERVKHLQADGKKVEFSFPDDLVVNLRGTSMTRYLKVNITLTSVHPNLESLVHEHAASIKHVANNILSNLTLADLEKREIKNVVGSQLKQQFNQKLNGPVIDEVLFTSWVVQ